MSNILDSEDYGLKIYNRFPPKYREDDVGQNFALKRYLQSLGDGGYKYVIEDTNNITSLIDPDTVDSSILPILFKQYGLEIFNGIPEQYLRYLLPRLGEAWSMKGSLEAIEFITTSLSGVKTSISITYDSLDNPYVSVKFEMDYNIGSYFPDNDQFKKLLTYFIPFYCDTAMVYFYLFYEKQLLVGKEYETINIHDNVSDSGIFKIRDLYDSEGSAFLGKAVLGEAIFNFTGVDSDDWEDHVHETKSDSGILSSPIDSLTNSNYNVLNSSFYTNGLHCYDIITTGDTQTIVLV